MKNGFIKYIFIVILISNWSVYDSYGQKHGTQLIDSLQKALINSKEDTNKVNLLNDIAANYYIINPDEGIKFGENALQLAQKLNWNKGIGWAYNKLGVNYWAKSDYTKALEYDIKALEIIKELSDKSGVAQVLGNIGIVYGDAGNNSKAIEYERQSLEIYEKLEDKKGIAKNLGNMGAVYNALGDYPKSMDCYFKALKIDETIGDKMGMAINSANIGDAFMLSGKDSDALIYEKRALQFFEESGAKNGIADTKRNIGGLYRNKGDQQKALEYCLSALNLYTEISDKSNIALTYDYIGTIYTTLKKYQLALPQYFKALEIAQQMDDKTGIARYMSNIGVNYLQMAEEKDRKSDDSLMVNTAEKQLAKSIYYLNLSINYCKETGYEETYNVYKNLSEAYSLSDNYKNALECYIQYTRSNDSLNSAKNKIAIANLETVRELEVKDQELKITELKKKNERIIYISGITFLLFIVAIIIVILYRQRMKVLNLSKEKLKNLKKIERQNELLKDITFDQAHTVRAPLATVLGLAYLFNKDDITDPVNIEVVTHMITAAERLDTIVKDVINKADNVLLKNED